MNENKIFFSENFKNASEHRLQENGRIPVPLIILSCLLPKKWNKNIEQN